MAKSPDDTEAVFAAAMRTGRACIVVTHDGTSADLLVQGEPHEVGQLMDALMRRLGLVDQEGASA